MKLLTTRNRQKAASLFVLFLFSLLYGCKEFLEEIIPRQPIHTQESADVVYDWYKLMVRIQLPANPQPNGILNNRNYGYIGIGLYEAVHPGIKGAVSLSSKLYQMPSMPEPDMYKDYVWGASANAALASMFKQFLTGLTEADIARIDSMEEAYNDHFRLSASDGAITRSQAFGRSIAAVIYDWSTSDNFNLSNEGYALPEIPGGWEPTPPAFASPVGPYLQNSRPFLASSLTATAPPLPFPYSEDPSSKFYQAAKEVYDISETLTDEEKSVSAWWADTGGAGVGVPFPYHTLSIITQVLESQHAKLGQAAQVYAKTGIGFKDGPIIVFRGKFQYNLVRPVTYINQHIDSTWQSYLINPPYPEYPAGLSGLYSPAMQILIREFGDIPVTDNTYDWRGDAPRQYASITDLDKEVARSRVYGGIHYQFTMDITRQIGKELGNKIADIDLTPKQ
jgi:hypothetical protein